jgi:hypothetical protein
MAPITVFEVLSSMNQAHPLRLACSLAIQRTYRSTSAFFGASGQLKKRVTSGIDGCLPKGFGVVYVRRAQPQPFCGHRWKFAGDLEHRWRPVVPVLEV